MKIDLDALKTLDTIARLGSFGAAAKALHKVPSALTYTINKLEESLGLEIFDRSGHKAELTQEGVFLLEQGRYLLEAAEHLERRLLQAHDGWEDELNLAIDVLVNPKPVFELIDLFYELKMPTKITLINEVFGGTWDALETGRADLVIGASGVSPNPNFHVEPLGVANRVFAVAPSHPLAKAKEPIDEQTITQYRAVSIKDTSRFFKPKHAPYLKMQPILTVGSLEQKLLAQEMGLGVGFLPVNIAKQAQQRGTLVIKEVNTPGSPMFQYIYRKGANGKALAWFIEKLKSPTLKDSLLKS